MKDCAKKGKEQVCATVCGTLWKRRWQSLFWSGLISCLIQSKCTLDREPNQQTDDKQSVGISCKMRVHLNTFAHWFLALVYHWFSLGCRLWTIHLEIPFFSEKKISLSLKVRTIMWANRDRNVKNRNMNSFHFKGRFGEHEWTHENKHLA